jgi:GMP synthase (glutamine-hydrolysing)
VTDLWVGYFAVGLSGPSIETCETGADTIVTSPAQTPPKKIMRQTLLLLDFGSQYTQLIARRVRERGVYCEIRPYHKALEAIDQLRPEGIIFSGGPASVYQKDSPTLPVEIFNCGVPILGICYGLQLTTHLLGGAVVKGLSREYGRASVSSLRGNLLLPEGDLFEAWMSHGDRVESLPEGFVALAQSEHSPFAAVANLEKKIYGVQFHPEVAHTPRGAELFENFARKICGITERFTPQSMITRAITQIQQQAKEGVILCGLSGGVDSAVAAALCHRAVGDRLVCVFVDNGLLRHDEVSDVLAAVEHLGVKVIHSDASEKFVEALRDVTEPEQKRKIIGRLFIEVFDEEAKKIPDVRYLAQGTLYPDVIESVAAHGGPTAVIKSHHNVGGLPEKMKLSLVEPLRELFKDEVRQVGLALGLSPNIVGRHPFPGPGLAIRIIGDITKERLHLLRHADKILRDEIVNFGQYEEVWQVFAVLLPVRSVGVKGDERSYDATIAIRAVTSVDGMTADWARLPYDCLAKISTRIMNEVSGVGRVVYDISQKPPATIEWE